MPPMQIALVYNKNNTFGLLKDANQLAEQLIVAGRKANIIIAKVRHMDPNEPPVSVDVCIHLEVPYSSWFPWARVNCMLVNPEWWLKSWNSYISVMDLFIFKTEAARMRVVGFCGLNARKTIVVPWATSRHLQDISTPQVKTSKKVGVAPTTTYKKECVWFIAGSVSKRTAAEHLLPYWRFDWPTLHVYSTSPLVLTKPVGHNVVIHVQDLSETEHAEIAKQYFGHICFSRAEAFGYTAAEAELLGVFMFLNSHETYESFYEDCSGIGWLQTPSVKSEEYPMAVFSEFLDGDRIENDLAFAIHKFIECDPDDLYRHRMAKFVTREQEFVDSLDNLLKKCQTVMTMNNPLPKHMPPILNVSDCPPISIITLTYNRPKFIENAIINLLSTDYPREKIEWIVVDDSDSDKSPSDRIVQFAEQFAPGKVVYNPCFTKLTIGRKRNIGSMKATNDIILMMDDDDHYPASSFRRRVAWLNKANRKYDAAVCTTIAMYDLVKGVSAVNVPPYTLGLAERCSEATLTFRKSFWSEKHFLEVNIAEGEAFLKGRESNVVEMPPQQIIVALNHKENLSGRRVPGKEPGCFWGFPRELLEFLHGLIGVKVDLE